MKLEIYDKIIHGILRPQNDETPTNYKEISHLLQEIPSTKKEIEKRINQVLGKNLQVQFNKEQPVNITKYLHESTYTPIVLDYFPPSVNLPLPTMETPQQRFYSYIITAEAQRIKLNLIQAVEILKDDLTAKHEVKEELKLLARYAKQIQESKQTNLIFNYLLTQIVNLYFELTLIFNELLSNKEYFSFSDFIYLQLNRQADKVEISAYQKALHIHQAQQVYNKFDSQSAQRLLTQLIADLENTPTDNTLIAVICALENAVFLQHFQALPLFEKIIDPEFTSLIINEQKSILRQRFEREEIALDRINIIDEIIVEISSNGLYTAKSDMSIAYNLLSYLNTQKEIYLREPNAQYKIVIEKQASELKKKPQPTTKPQKINTKLAKARMHLAYLNGVNPKNDMRYMSEEDYILLIDYIEYLIKNGSIPNITRKIQKCNIPKTWLKYTLYLIHQELYDSIQDVWIEFMQASFEVFSSDIVTFSTLKTKFSVYPSGYNQTVKYISE